MKNHSVIFIDLPRYERLEKLNKENFLTKAAVYLSVNPKELPKRIFTSFVPPIINVEYRKVYVDFLGPLMAVILLGSILQYGYSNKHPSSRMDTSPSVVLAYYTLLMPLLCSSLAKLGQSNLDVAQIISLLGYALYGHVFTVGTCYLFAKESSDLLFIFLMILFGGTSGLRIVIVLLMTIPKPAARLLICSLVSIIHLLFLVFIHYAFMHQTFFYGKN